MFEFFKGTIENLGLKLIDNFSDKLLDFIKYIIKDDNNEEDIIGSSGGYAQIGSSGDSARIGSSGGYAQIGSSGYYAKIGSSGYYAKIGSSGYSALIGSSGGNAQIGSSGDSARIGSSGYNAKIGSSGYYARIGSSGGNAQIGSSGDSARIGSSGDNAQIDILGNNAVGFACGYKTIIKAKKGTWISLCEYKLKNNEYIPFYAVSAQIGNKEYKDVRGKTLNEKEYYTLYNKKLYPVDISDGIETIKISEKKKDDLIIIKGILLDSDLANDDEEEVYLVKQNNLNAHGETLQQAMQDLQYKKLKSEEVEKIAEEIRKTKKVNRTQYRIITGACSFGTEQFCKKHNIPEEQEEIELEDLRKILINDFGAERFWNLIDKGRE